MGAEQGMQRVAVVGATGPTGWHLVRRFHEQGLAVRAVSRSREHLEHCFPDTGIERVVADALDPDTMRPVVEGCDLLVDCIGLPPDRMEEHAATARVLAEAARQAGARSLQVSSCWAFLPVRKLPVDESHPRTGGNRYARARRAAEDVMLEAGAAVVHLPDFFGPRVHTSTLQSALKEAAAGKVVNWIGSGDVEREYIYVPDAMAMVAQLAERPEAYGASWILPGSGPLHARHLVEILERHLGRSVRLRTAPGWLLKALALVSADLRAFRPIVDDYLQPVRYDSSRAQGLLGSVHNTSYEEAIPATLEWLAQGS